MYWLSLICNAQKYISAIAATAEIQFDQHFFDWSCFGCLCSKEDSLTLKVTGTGLKQWPVYTGMPVVQFETLRLAAASRLLHPTFTFSSLNSYVDALLLFCTFAPLLLDWNFRWWWGLIIKIVGWMLKTTYVEWLKVGVKKYFLHYTCFRKTNTSTYWLSSGSTGYIFLPLRGKDSR